VKAFPVLFAAALALPALPAIDRWLWNARERTATALAALAAGDGARAVAAAETAARVAPDDPAVRYNAGATHLAAAASVDDPAARQAATSAALPHLEAAAEAVGSEGLEGDLAADTWYDLGTGRLQSGEAASAVEALSEALRRAPDRADAKHNLELALQALEQQRQQQQQQQQASPQDGEDQEDGQPQQRQQPDQGGDPGEREQQQQQQQGRQPDQGENRPQQPGEPRDGGGEPRREGPLPDFVDQPELTREQAAALLEAVENRERQERRKAAAARARERSREEKDW
jgi:Ca-activated chloride channel family protein